MRQQKSGKMARNINLAALFNVEGIITPKHLNTETKHDIDRKTGKELVDEVHLLLTDITDRVADMNLDEILKNIEAIQLRVNSMRSIATDLKKKYR